MGSRQKVLLEVCVGSVWDAVRAAENGADRLELCSGLELGGLTPSAGMIAEVVRSVEIPVVVMLRPRAGGFCYAEADFRAMLHDAEQALEAGASGLVFGVLRGNGQIDQERCGRLVEAAGDRQRVFHRAFDVVPDPLAALEQLIELGVTRVLTSGRQPTCAAGYLSGSSPVGPLSSTFLPGQM